MLSSFFQALRIFSLFIQESLVKTQMHTINLLGIKTLIQARGIILVLL